MVAREISFLEVSLLWILVSGVDWSEAKKQSLATKLDTYRSLWICLQRSTCIIWPQVEKLLAQSVVHAFLQHVQHFLCLHCLSERSLLQDNSRSQKSSFSFDISFLHFPSKSFESFLPFFVLLFSGNTVCRSCSRRYVSTGSRSRWELSTFSIYFRTHLASVFFISW